MFILDFVISKENTLYIFLKCTWQTFVLQISCSDKKAQLKTGNGIPTTSEIIQTSEHKKCQGSDKTPGDFFQKSYIFKHTDAITFS